MRKTLLILLAMFVCGSVFAEKYNLSLEELTNGWESSYDAGTKTITYDGAWGGRGWDLGNGDFSAYTRIVVNIEASAGALGLTIEYTGYDYNDSSTHHLHQAANFPIGSTELVIKLNPEYTGSVQQVYVQNQSGIVGATCTLVEAFFDDYVETIDPTTVIDFENDEIGASYPTVGWSAEAVTAEVVANPSGAGQSLALTIGNWNSAARFNTIKFPGDQTLADVEKIKFDIYLDAASPDIKWKDINFWFGAEGATFGAADPTFGINNLLAEETLGVWIEKEVDMSTITYPSNLLTLNLFDMAIGVNCGSGNKYYLDNITFIGIDGVAIAQIKADAPMILPTSNGIKVANNGERVMVYGFDGRLLVQTYNSEIALAKGLYIVKVGNYNAQKVLVK